MLVLKRRRNQSIIIGSGDTAVAITVTDVRCGAARIGFSGPKEVQVRRDEIVPDDEMQLIRDRLRLRPSEPDTEEGES